VIGAPQGGYSKYEDITFLATLTGATGGTLDVYVQHSADGVDWYDYVHFSQLAPAAAAATYSYPPALNDNIVAVGKGTAGSAGPLTLPPGTVAGGRCHDQLRTVFVAGASTSAGAAQVVNVLATRRLY
jgi:hypothetical protein